MHGFLKRCFAPPYATLSWLITANIAVSVVMWLSFLAEYIFGFSAGSIVDALALPAEFSRFILRPWTLLTYMFTQVNPLQLLFNMLWLAWFGSFLLDTDSSRTLLRLYVGGGITGAICYLAAGAMIPGSGSILLGSSAATLSVMLYTSIRQPDRHVQFFAVGAVRLKWIAVATVILTLLSASGAAAYLAHLGGMLFPIVIWLMRKTHFRTIKKEKPKKRKSPFRKDVPAGSPVPPEEVIDRLLDKIRVSGYASLSSAEKAILERASEHLNENPDCYKRH